jgi:hypothetical protein
VGIDNLVKERTIIKQMREAYEGKEAKPSMPMQFAGIIMEGGIIGYDSSTNSGGAAMRIFGIGKQTQWTSDVVTVSLRAVSVNTGKVLASVTVQKSILSTADSATALKFFDSGTQAFEAEAGLTINEPGTYAVKAATELAVVELIKEGQRKGVWEYKHDPVVVTSLPQIPPPAPVISSEIKKPEVKVEIKKPEPVAEEKNPEIKPVDPTEFITRPTEEKVVIPAPKVEEKKSEVKVDRPLFGQRKLKEDSYLYVEADVKTTKRWQLKKGTVLNVIQPGSEGWVRVKDSESRGGWIQTEQLEEVK